MSLSHNLIIMRQEKAHARTRKPCQGTGFEAQTVRKGGENGALVAESIQLSGQLFNPRQIQTAGITIKCPIGRQCRRRQAGLDQEGDDPFCPIGVFIILGVALHKEFLLSGNPQPGTCHRASPQSQVYDREM